MTACDICVNRATEPGTSANLMRKANSSVHRSGSYRSTLGSLPTWRVRVVCNDRRLARSARRTPPHFPLHGLPIPTPLGGPPSHLCSTAAPSPSAPARPRRWKNSATLPAPIVSPAWPPHGGNLMDEGMGVPGGVVEENFGSHLTSALLIHSRERCIAYRFPPAPTAERRRIFRCTAYQFPRHSGGRHRISVRPLLPHRPHLPAHADGKILPGCPHPYCTQQAHRSTGKSGIMNLSTFRQLAHGSVQTARSAGMNSAHSWHTMRVSGHRLSFPGRSSISYPAQKCPRLRTNGAQTVCMSYHLVAKEQYQSQPMFTRIRVCLLLALISAQGLSAADFDMKVTDKNYLDTQGFSIFLYDSTYPTTAPTIPFLWTKRTRPWR